MATLLRGHDTAVDHSWWTLSCQAGLSLVWRATGSVAVPRSRRAQAILAYLAICPSHRATRDRLISLLWANRGSEQAHASLRQAIMELRRLGDGVHSPIDADRHHVWLRAGSIIIEENEVPSDGSALLQGLEHITPEFDSWLTELRRLRAQPAPRFASASRLRPVAAAALLFGVAWLMPPQKQSQELVTGEAEALTRLAAAQVKAGDYAAACETYEKAATLEPTKVNVGNAASCAQRRREQLDANIYARLASADPDGWTEVRARLAYERGDLSQVLALGVANLRLVRTSPYMNYLFSMSHHDLGEKKLGSTLEGLSPASRELALGRAPVTPGLLRQAREFIGTTEERTFFGLANVVLAKDGRWDDIVLLYDQRLGPFGELARNRLGVSDTMWMGAYAALALREVGRREESNQMLARVEKACAKLAANGSSLPADIWMTMAQHHAINGKPAQALEEMRRAIDHGWMGQDSFYQDLGEDPLFAHLRGNATFEQVRRALRERLARERAQAQAADLI